MTYPSTVKGCLRLFAMVVGLPLCVQAAIPEPVDDATLKLDSNIQALKADVLDINQRGTEIEENFLYPEQTRVTVYIGVKAPGLLLNDVTITVDDGTPIRHDYTTLEAIVLQRRGLYRFLRLNAQPGAHRIKASFNAHFADARPDEPLINGSYEAVFEKTTRPAELEMSISRDSHRSITALKLRDWRSTQ